jgi:calpain-7
MSVDLREQFRLTMPYTDRSGHLALSPKQLKHFARWARPEEICAEPTMVAQGGVDCWSIKQTIVSDCSFVASLAIGALYERRFNKKIISSVIYPCNSKQDPVYNPFGKYMMKFHINGITRKVVIDDYLPVGKHGELLCSYSTNKNELWISLIEKAYMKIMGGYDFPGSNSVSTQFLLVFINVKLSTENKINRLLYKIKNYLLRFANSKSFNNI